jgi:two-component system, LytTR family, sensor kinase
MGKRAKRWLREWAICFLVWTALALFFFSQGLTEKFLAREPTPWWHYLVSWLTGSYIWAFLTPAVLWLGRRFPFNRRNWMRRAGLHLLFSVAVVFAQMMLEAELLFHFGVFPSIMKSVTVTFFFLVMIGFHDNVITYWLMLGIQSAFRYYRGYQDRQREALRLEVHASALESQLARAHLSALKMQLQPHFLFNTLNAIMVLVRQQKTRQAEEMLARLSDLLRCVLDDVDAQEVPLQRELEYLRLYLSIEQVRFQDRLEIDISPDPLVLDAAFPHMGLQPIVENAIRHGIGRSSSAGKIRIRAARSDDALCVTVEDDGPGLDEPNSRPNQGIGLTNTRARLNQLYGDAGRLTIGNGPQGGALVTLVLPFHRLLQVSEMEALEIHALDSVDR